jgi:hypothetical protein
MVSQFFRSIKISVSAGAVDWRDPASTKVAPAGSFWAAAGFCQNEKCSEIASLYFAVLNDEIFNWTST